jgi:hypothetical protein
MDQVIEKELAWCTRGRCNRPDDTMQRPLVNHTFIVGHFDNNDHNGTCFNCEISSFHLSIYSLSDSLEYDVACVWMLCD